MVRAKLKTKSAYQPEYQLKHRITGAVIMVAMAVMIIPLLLKEPGLEASVASTAKNADGQESFKSKIEPMNLDNINLPIPEENAGISSDDDGLKPALMEVTNIAPAEDSSQKAISQTNQQVTETQSQSASTTESIVLTADPNTDSAVSLPAEQSVASTEALTEGNLGWTVRVGTFSKSENVESVSALLTNSGFKARHTKVETTLGEATRIWLGPYSKKKTAEKISARLKKLTGEKGYVTKYTS